jgi:hypothetical protein
MMMRLVHVYIQSPNIASLDGGDASVDQNIDSVQVHSHLPPFLNVGFLQKQSINATLSRLLRRYSPLGLKRPAKVPNGVAAPIEHHLIAILESPGVSPVPNLEVLVQLPLRHCCKVIVRLDKFRRVHALLGAGAVIRSEGRAATIVGDDCEQRGKGGKQGSGGGKEGLMGVGCC